MNTAYYTKLSGTSFRQDVISKLTPGKSKLMCVACPDNEYDEFAVRVDALVDSEWTQIGWIQKGKNVAISQHLQKGGEVDIQLSDVTGGTDGKNYGVNVGISYSVEEQVDTKDLPRQKVIVGDEDYILWDEQAHNAYSLDGHKLLSGSRAEHIFCPEPDLKYPLKALSKSTGVKEGDIETLWDFKRELAAGYGTLIHRALECYLVMRKQSEQVDTNRERKVSAKNWMPEDLGEIVDDFVLSCFGEKLPSKFLCEARVKWGNATGIIDLLVESDGGYIINDYKVTKEIKGCKYEGFGDFPKYTVQQNFYREILESLGHKVYGMFLWQWNDGWERHKVPKLNVMEKLHELKSL